VVSKDRRFLQRPTPPDCDGSEGAAAPGISLFFFPLSNHRERDRVGISSAESSAIGDLAGCARERAANKAVVTLILLIFMHITFRK